MQCLRPAVRVLTVLLFATLSSGILGGCGDERGTERREWRADDHQTPPSSDNPAPGMGTSTTEPSPEVVARAAQALFQSRCAGCHGVDGRGGGPEVPPGTDLPDLTTAEYQQGHSDAEIARAIRMGRGLMPAFGSQINQRGIDALVGHVRTLAESP